MIEQEGKVRSLSKAIDLLDILSASRDGMKLGELCARSGYPKSTAHALLSTMRDRGLVTQRDDGRYALGLRLFEYGAAVSRGFDVNTISRPYLERLSSLTGANAVISMIDGSGVVAFDYAASATGIQIMPEIGVRLPLHATSQGKLMLSCLTPKKALTLLEKRGMPPYTPHTIAEAQMLLRELDAIRSRGYAVEDGEYKIGLRSVSAPVYDSAGEVKYVLTTIGFFRRTTSDDFLFAIDSTVAQARRLSSAMGYQ
jgi:IclR family acetate operon transcriptional repressor